MDQDRQNLQFLVKEWSGNHNKRTANLLGYFSLERISFVRFSSSSRQVKEYESKFGLHFTRLISVG